MPNPNSKGISVQIDRELHAEITAYLQEHNMKMADFITIQDGNYILRIRDDGVPFNPLEQKVSAEGPVVGGIALIRKLMSDFQYTRVLNMNNTVIGLEINDGRQGDLVRRG